MREPNVHDALWTDMDMDVQKVMESVYRWFDLNSPDSVLGEPGKKTYENAILVLPMDNLSDPGEDVGAFYRRCVAFAGDVAGYFNPYPFSVTQVREWLITTIEEGWPPCDVETFPGRGPTYDCGGEPPEGCENMAMPGRTVCDQHPHAHADDFEDPENVFYEFDEVEGL